MDDLKSAGDRLQIIYDGADIRVVMRGAERSRMLVAFSHWAARPPHKPVLPTMAADFGMGYACFLAKRNHWWQTRDFPAACAALAEKLTLDIALEGFGASMGGAGAMLAAQYLPMQRLLAAVPLIYVDPAWAPWETRFQQVVEDCRVIHPLAPALNAGMVHHVIYDPFFAADTAHLPQVRATGRNLIRWPLPFAGHTPLLHMKDSGRLRDFFDAYFRRQDFTAARAIIRNCRNDHGQMGLGWLKIQRGRTDPLSDAGYLRGLTAIEARFGPNEALLEAKFDACLQLRQYQQADQIITLLERDFLAQRPAKIARMRHLLGRA